MAMQQQHQSLFYATTSAHMRSLEYLNFNEPAEDGNTTDSTYHSSGFKPTPFDPGFVEKDDVAGFGKRNQISDLDQMTGYFLRSSKGTAGLRTGLELPKICTDSDLCTKAPLRKSKLELPERKGVKKVQIVLENCEEKGSLFSFDKEAKIAKSGSAKKKVQITAPLTKKSFEEKPHDNLSLEVATMKAAPVAVRPGSFNANPTDQKPETRTFLMIKEREFPHLFEHSILRQQKKSKYLDEIDFNSDCETIERNSTDLLSEVFSSIERFTKRDPTRFIENLKLPNDDVDAATLQQKLDKARDQRTPDFAFSITTQES